MDCDRSDRICRWSRTKLTRLISLVDGQACEIVGRISMDQITIRLPRAYPLGQKVTLIGQDGDKTISVQEWADRIGTINYEVVCLLTDRLPRIFE